MGIKSCHKIGNMDRKQAKNMFKPGTLDKGAVIEES